MAASVAMLSACAALLLAVLAASSAAAQATGNMAFLSPIKNLESLAKPEPESVLQLHRRSLLRHGDDDDDNRSYREENLDWGRTGPDTDAVFAQGVASGDPYAKSVILWARVTPPSSAASGPAAVYWAVARDRRFRHIESSGSTVTNADVDYTSKVEARKLKPFTRYYYQWAYRPSGRGTPVFSRIGRTKTLPRANDDIRRIRLGHFGCSNVPNGFFSGYGQIAMAADRGEIDYNLHSGDYIYEGGGAGTTDLDPAFRALRNHMPPREILNLIDYRTRYQQYNSDNDTRAMREAAPLIPVWDDHEYANNAYDGGAQQHDPVTEGPWNARRLVALQVYYEQMPIRQINADNKQQIYRSFEIGKLIKLIMLDTRVIGRDRQNVTARDDPSRTILGAPQKAFLQSELLAADRKQTWKVLGQQVIFAHRCDGLSDDRWDGYRSDQKGLLTFLQQNKIDNTIVLTGDSHAHWAFDLPLNPCPAEPDFAYNNVTGGGSLAVEFVSSSISSAYNPARNNQTAAAPAARLKDGNPHLKYYENYKGWAILDVTRRHVTNTWYFTPNIGVPGDYTKIQGESWRVYDKENKLTKLERLE